MAAKLKVVLKEIYEIYVTKRVTRAAAALSYYLTLSIFPLLICVSEIISSFDINQAELLETANGLLPDNILGAISSYLEYVSTNNSPLLIVAAVSLLATSSAAAFRGLISTMEEIQGKVRYNGILRWVSSFLVSVIFLFAVYAACLIMLSGQWLLNTFGLMEIAFFSDVWHWLRFVIMFLLIYFLVLLIYLMTVPRGNKDVRVGVGALLAALLVVGVSIVFSLLMGESVKYSLVYGSLTSVIILMVWLYTLGLVIIMGSVINRIVRKHIKAHREEAEKKALEEAEQKALAEAEAKTKA